MNLVLPMKQAMNCMPVKVIVSPQVIEEEEIVVCHIVRIIVAETICCHFTEYLKIEYWKKRG